MARLHRGGLIHKDIKASHILIDPETNGTVAAGMVTEVQVAETIEEPGLAATQSVTAEERVLRWGHRGGIVELRRFEDTKGRPRVALAVRSDLNLEQQVAAEGATWLDRRLVAREPSVLSRAGFGAEVRAALDRRIDALAERGLVRRDGETVVLGRTTVGIAQ